MKVVINDEAHPLFRFAGFGLAVDQQLMIIGDHPALAEGEFDLRLTFIQLDFGLVREVFAQSHHVARRARCSYLGMKLGHGDLQKSAVARWLRRLG